MRAGSVSWLLMFETMFRADNFPHLRLKGLRNAAECWGKAFDQLLASPWAMPALFKLACLLAGEGGGAPGGIGHRSSVSQRDLSGCSTVLVRRHTCGQNQNPPGVWVGASPGGPVDGGPLCTTGHCDWWIYCLEISGSNLFH